MTVKSGALKAEISNVLQTGFPGGEIPRSRLPFLSFQLRSPAKIMHALPALLHPEQLQEEVGGQEGALWPPGVKARPSKEPASCQRWAQRTGGNALNKCFHFGIWRRAEPGQASEHSEVLWAR